MSFKFISHVPEMSQAMERAVLSWLEEASGEIEAQTKQNSRVDTGETRGSFQHMVDEGEKAGYVGSDHENAIWEEYGTGQYALKGGGRKTPWRYKDQKGKWHTTTGKRGTRALFKAFQTLKKPLIDRAMARLKELEG